MLQTDREWVIRSSGASSLGELRTKAGIAALRRAVAKDRNWCVRSYAADALCRTGDRSHLDLMLRQVNRESEPATKVAILYSLCLLGEEQYLESIIDILEEPDHWYMTYLKACGALEELLIDARRPVPPRLFPALEKVMTYDVGKAASSSAEKLLAKLRVGMV